MPTLARRLSNAVCLLGSPRDAEVLAAAEAIGDALEEAGMAWRDLAALIASRAAEPAFSFAGTTPRAARKLMVHLARQPGTTPLDRSQLKRLRSRLQGVRTWPETSSDDIAWLDALWRTAHRSPPVRA